LEQRRVTTQTLQSVPGLHRRVAGLEELVAKLAERVAELERGGGA
jgi:tRNA pseudouridine-54 N-methylase